MNEEAMTPDKEQVVERLSASDASYPCIRCGTSLWHCGAPADPCCGDSDHPFATVEETIRALNDDLQAEHQSIADAARTASVAGLDIERALRVVFAQYAIVPDRQFIDGPHVVVVGTSQEAAAVIAPKVARARTASVAGLDRYYRAEPLGDDDDGWVVCRGANRVLVVADEAEASRVVSGLNADLFHAAPSIEQEPGETAAELAGVAAMPLPWGVHEQKLALHAVRAALREQEPGETLRAAHDNWHDATCSGNCEIMRFVRAVLEANPQETER